MSDSSCSLVRAVTLLPTYSPLCSAVSLCVGSTSIDRLSSLCSSQTCLSATNSSGLNFSFKNKIGNCVLHDVIPCMDMFAYVQFHLGDECSEVADILPYAVDASFPRIKKWSVKQNSQEDDINIAVTFSETLAAFDPAMWSVANGDLQEVTLHTTTLRFLETQ